MIKLTMSIIGMFLLCEIVVSQELSHSPQMFSLNVHYKEKDTGRLILWYSCIAGVYIRDTIVLMAGKGLFTGFANEPIFSHLIDLNNGENRISFFIEPGALDVYVSENELNEARLFGSPSQEEWVSYLISNKDIQGERDRLSLKLSKLNDNAKKERDTVLLFKLKEQIEFISDQIDSINKVSASKNINYIQEHTNSYISSTLLYGLLVNRLVENKTAVILFEELASMVQQGKTGQLISTEFAKRQIGKSAADFSVTDINRDTVILSQLRGKHVLLNFWASWCVPCITKLPQLTSLYRQFSDKGLEIVNISIDIKRDNWLKAVKKFGLAPWKNVLASDNPFLSEKYSNIVSPIPSEILINKSGVIIWNSDGDMMLPLDKTLDLSINGRK